MSKLTINLASESAAANPFLSADGLLNLIEVNKLAAKISTANTAAGKAATAAAASPDKVKLPKFVTPILYTRKALVKFQAALDKKNDHKYKLARGQLVKSRTKMPLPDSRVKIVVLCPGLRDGAAKELLTSVKKLIVAVNTHNRKATSMVGKVKTEKGKMRDAANAAFDKSIQMLKTVLTAAGVKETDMVESTGMMGKSVLLRLGKDNVVSIGKADAKRFAAAVKASKAAA